MSPTCPRCGSDRALGEIEVHTPLGEGEWVERRMLVCASCQVVVGPLPREDGARALAL
jgi:hypothetical protein